MCGRRTQVRRAFQLLPTHRASCYFQRANTPEPYIAQKITKLVDPKPSPVMSQDLCPNGSIAMIDYQPILLKYRNSTGSLRKQVTEASAAYPTLEPLSTDLLVQAVCPRFPPFVYLAWQ